MILADVAHVLHQRIPDLRRERWSDLLALHREATRILSDRFVKLTGDDHDGGPEF